METTHYEILLNAPKQIPITVEEFNNLSYYGLANLMVNYPVIFERTDEYLKMWGNSSKLWNVYQNHRFSELDWYEDESAELYECRIPLDNPVVKTIERLFSHLILQ